MADLKNIATYRRLLARSIIWAALALCTAGSPLLAQETIGGNFTLHESARFGSTILGAGEYKFSIAPVGAVQSMHSIQQGAGHLVLVVVKPAKTGPMASVFAMASPSNHELAASELVLEPEKTAALAESMYLQKEGLVVDFHWWGSKAKSPVVARQGVPVQSVAVRQSGGKD